MLTGLRAPPPRHSGVRLTNQDKIAFLHPGYSAPRNQLFSLPRVDAVDGDGGSKCGVHHLTALTACQVVANNAFRQGRLCTDTEGLRPAAEPMDGVLTAPHYYLVIDGNDQYPVVPSFQDWEFPHANFPTTWPAPSETQHEGPLAPPAPAATTRHCVVTNSGLASTSAHLVPREHDLWFSLNAMSIYGTGVRDIDDESNLVRMRADIHKCFDDRLFTMVPKPDGDSGLHYAVHAVDEGDTEFRDLHHNTAVQNIARVSREYAFARFAWCVLLRLKPFLLGGIPRRVVRFGLFGGGEPESRTERMDGSQLRDLFGAGKSRSSSPRKRKLEPPPGQLPDASLAGSGSCSSTAIGVEDEGEADDWYERNVEHSPRGRTRKRACHSFDGKRRHEADFGAAVSLVQGQGELMQPRGG